MQVSREEILHIANLAQLEIKEDEIDKYLSNLEDILKFVEILDKANVDNLDVTVGTNEGENIFRKDEVKVFEDNESLLQNAAEQCDNMFRIPKVIS